MSDGLIPDILTARKSSLGDRMRTIASQLRQEDDVQIKATSRILGAAAKLVENHDHLIDEVVEMVEQDLDQSAQALKAKSYTVDQLKQQFKTLKNTKAHFGIKASSWDALVNQLNGFPSDPEAKTPPQSTNRVSTNVAKDFTAQRLEKIEHEIQQMRGEIYQVIQLLELLCKTVQ